MNDEKSLIEEYKSVWCQFYCAALSSFDHGDERDRVRCAEAIADLAIEKYIKKQNYFRELALKAFK